MHSFILSQRNRENVAKSFAKNPRKLTTEMHVESTGSIDRARATSKEIREASAHCVHLHFPRAS